MNIEHASRLDQSYPTSSGYLSTRVEGNFPEKVPHPLTTRFTPSTPSIQPNQSSSIISFWLMEIGKHFWHQWYCYSKILSTGPRECSSPCLECRVTWFFKAVYFFPNLFFLPRMWAWWINKFMRSGRLSWKTHLLRNVQSTLSVYIINSNIIYSILDESKICRTHV